MPDLTVVLSTLGNYDVLRRVLDGYSAQDAPAGSFEVAVVVDRADPEPGAVDAAIGERPYPVRRLTGHIPGLSANRNTGWRAAAGRLVLFTDNDTIPVPRLVSEHLRGHRAHPEDNVGVLGHVRWAPELRVTPFMLWLDRGIQFDYLGIVGTDPGPGRFYGANSSLKRALLERVGGFEEGRLPYGFEDVEWAYRAARDHDFRLVYAREAIVDHLRPMTLEFWKRRARRLGASERRLVEMHAELEPRMRWMFERALAQPRSRGRWARLYPYVSQKLPWLGPRVHVSTDLYFKQSLAPEFLAGWESAGGGRDDSVCPDVSEHDL
jgi:GT2 family glycosyltransferase